MNLGIIQSLMRMIETEPLVKMLSGPRASGRPGYAGRPRGKGAPRRSRPNRLHASRNARARHKRRAA